MKTPKQQHRTTKQTQTPIATNFTQLSWFAPRLAAQQATKNTHPDPVKQITHTKAAKNEQTKRQTKTTNEHAVRFHLTRSQQKAPM